MNKPFSWSKLISHLGSQSRAFEELCKQLFCNEFRHLGACRRIGGPGQSQKGVEAVIPLKDGSEIGMEAKWFTGSIKTSRRKQKVENSLKRAVKRKKLRRWLLCAPISEFDDADWKWWDSLKKKYPQIKLEDPWLSGTLMEKLMKPENQGRKAWFFGELELTPEWFKTTFYSTLSSLSSKYLPKLHVAGNADEQIQLLLGDDQLIRRVKDNCERLKPLRRRLDTLRKGLKAGISEEGVLGKLSKLDKHILLLDKNLDVFLEQAFGLANALKSKNLIEAQEQKFIERLIAEENHDTKGLSGSLWRVLEEIRYTEAAMKFEIGGLEICFKSRSWIKDGKNLLVEDSKEEGLSITIKKHLEEEVSMTLKKELFSRYRNLRKVRDFEKTLKSFLTEQFKPFVKDFERVREKAGELQEIISEILNCHSSIIFAIERFQNKQLIFLSKPSIGKTHLILKSCEQQISKGRPVLLLLGSRIQSQHTLKDQIIEQLGMQRFSWEEVVGALESYAEAHKMRLLFAFDALNESPVWESRICNELYEALLPFMQSEWFGIVLTSRQTYAKPLFGKERPDSSYYLREDEDIEKYKAVYFRHFKIKIKSVSPSLWAQLSDRFFVTLIAKTYGDPRAVKERELSIENLGINDVFEDYLQKIDKAVCTKLRAPTGCSLIRKKLLAFAKSLWQENAVQLTKYEALAIMEEKDPSLVDTRASWVYKICDEGLLVDFEWSDKGEILEFSNQRLAEYLIACSIVEGKTEAQILKTIKRHTGHPRFLDILELVAILLPKVLNKHLYQILPQEEKYALAQKRALFEMNPSLITTKEKKWLIGFFDRISISKKQEVFLDLAFCAPFPDYPFNAKFTTKLLKKLSMQERDLIWTEWLRRGAIRGITEYPEDFETRVRRDSIRVEKACLVAEFLMWFLTSTNRALRDKATRALYWFGRNSPERLFNLTINSLEINDQYVPERMLAASYGVAMALHNDRSLRGFVSETLPTYAKALYESMFKKETAHSTTHLLARDYARRTIEIALIHNPDLLRPKEVKRITPPFRDGGVRKWGENEDRNKGEYRGGNYPLGFDWGNYTLGRLVPKRRPYQTTHDFEKVKRHIWWRIYQLGYSLRAFGEIDKQIAESNFRFSRGTDHSKIERYGKKCCWIAFFELAGYLVDKGKLKDDWNEWHIRSSEVDIDPSFPEPPAKIPIIKDNYVDLKCSLADWISTDKPIDLSRYLKMNKIGGQKGPWVLLNGYIKQQRKKQGKGIFIFSRGVFVKKTEVRELTKLFSQKGKPYLGDPSRIPDSEKDYYTYAGEIPWCETFPYTQYPQSIEFVLAAKKVKVKKKGYTLVYENGKEISQKDQDILVKLYIRKKMSKLSKFLRDKKLQRKEIEYIEEEERKKSKKFDILIPVRDFSWEGYHSVVNSSGGAEVPIKELAAELKLYSLPQSFDLYDQNGKQASFSIRFGNLWRNGYELTYIRQDLLEKYLRKHRSGLVWLIWGERQLEAWKSRTQEWEKLRKKYRRTFKMFKSAIEYS